SLLSFLKAGAKVRLFFITPNYSTKKLCQKAYFLSLSPQKAPDTYIIYIKGHINLPRITAFSFFSFIFAFKIIRTTKNERFL
ncbi:MAG: hypothetical protein Q4E60_10800, partial [Bacteroidales bacterium]|nr:hypothetical protein [Bacteroidales bacterium]